MMAKGLVGAVALLSAALPTEGRGRSAHCALGDDCEDLECLLCAKTLGDSTSS